MTKPGYVLLASGAALLTLVAVALPTTAADPLENRYPYDPACAWGRVADGKGMIVRCLGEQEAAALGKKAEPAKTEPAKTEAGKTEPSASATTPKEATESKADAGASDTIAVELVDVKADVGKLATAVKKLQAPKDKYLACVRDHGGLDGKNGEVQVRFLVRQRGRAEGVSVAKRTGVTAEAARCIAEVVDRRPVGTPEEEMVGATAVFRITRP